MKAKTHKITFEDGTVMVVKMATSRCGEQSFKLHFDRKVAVSQVQFYTGSDVTQLHIAKVGA